MSFRKLFLNKLFSHFRMLSFSIYKATFERFCQRIKVGFIFVQFDGRVEEIGHTEMGCFMSVRGA